MWKDTEIKRIKELDEKGAITEKENEELENLLRIYDIEYFRQYCEKQEEIKKWNEEVEKCAKEFERVGFINIAKLKREQIIVR